VAAEGKMNLEAIANSNPMKRLAERQEIADAVMFLCGEKSSFITGQIICVDGGFSINPLYR
jgi:Tropinone reductase 1